MRFDVYMLSATHCTVVVLGGASLVLISVGMLGNTKVQIYCNPTYCKFKLILKHMCNSQRHKITKMFGSRPACMFLHEFIVLCAAGIRRCQHGHNSQLSIIISLHGRSLCTVCIKVGRV